MDVKLQFRERRESFTVYVADMDDSCILTMDYLSSHKCVLDFRTMQMTMDSNKMLLRAMDREGLPLKAMSTTVIPPMSSMLFPCRTVDLTRTVLRD